MTEALTVDGYLAAQPATARRVLAKVRATLRKALPEAEEVISYQIPAYRLHGRMVLYFAGWKQHYALYPVTQALTAAFKKELAPYELSNKGTVRFPLDAPAPLALIGRIAKYRAAEVAALAEAKAAGKRKARVEAKAKPRPKPKAKATRKTMR